VIGCPSENAAPRRRCQVEVRPSGLFLADGERAAVMVNEEDHLRLTAVVSGFELDRACIEAVVRGARQIGPEQTLSINISPRSLEAPEFNVGSLASLLAHYGFEPPRVTLELTEREAVEDIDRAISDLRNYIFGLRPGILADRQLDEAIHDLCRDFEERSGVVTVADAIGTLAEADVFNDLSVTFGADLVQGIVEAAFAPESYGTEELPDIEVPA